MTDTASRPRARDDVLFRQLADEWVLFDPASNRLHALNLSAALVWTYLDGTRDVDALAREVAAAFAKPPDPGQVRGDVEAALERFRAEGLLEP